MLPSFVSRPGWSAWRTTSALITAGLGLLLLPLLALPAQAAETSWVRAGHFVSGLGPVQVSLTPFGGVSPAAPAMNLSPSAAAPAAAQGGALIVTQATSYGAISEYRQVPPGFYSVTVRPASGGAPLIAGTLQAQPGQAVTLAVLGTPADPRVQVLDDDLTPPPAGQARVRLLPAAPQAPTVKVSALGAGLIADKAAFAQPTGYADVAAGTWTLRTTVGSDGTSTLSKVALRAGNVYTLLVLDQGQTLTVKPVVDAVSASVMPRAGVQTGAGGTAPSSTEGLTGLLGLAVLVLGVTVTTRQRAGATLSGRTR